LIFFNKNRNQRLIPKLLYKLLKTLYFNFFMIIKNKKIIIIVIIIVIKLNIITFILL